MQNKSPAIWWWAGGGTKLLDGRQPAAMYQSGWPDLCGSSLGNR